MNKKNIAKGLVFTTALVNVPIDSLADTIEEYKITNTKDSVKDNNIGDSIKKLFAKIVEPMEDYVSKPREVIKVNSNVRTGTVLEIRLTDSSQFVQDLSGNPGGYETVKVITEGDKKLVEADYNKLRLSGIPKVDLSNAHSDSIPAGAFSYATWLTEFKFPIGVKTIEKGRYDSSLGYIGAFSGCTSLIGNLEIPNSITSIGDYSFYRCRGFDGTLTIPNSVTRIGQYAFYECSGFTGSLTIGNSVTNIGQSAFEGCSGFTGDLVIPNSVRSIGTYAFYGCSGFNGDLVIGNSVTTIGTRAFEECSGFNGNLIIGNSMKTIETRAFEGCSGFTGDLVIPDSVISIGDYAFSNCSGFNGNLIIGNSMTTIGTRAFEKCSGFTGDLVIPDSVTSIENYAFSRCSGFTGDLVIPDSVTSIESYAFSNCSGFNGNLIIPDSVVSIGSYAFQSCNGFTGNLAIPDSLTSIGSNVFQGCNGFTGNLAIPDSLTSIGSNVFNNTNIEKIIIKIDESYEGVNYRKSIIEKLPIDKTYLEMSYNFNTANTWLEASNYIKSQPKISTYAGVFENNEGVGISLEITEASPIKTMAISKDGISYNIEKDENGKYVFVESGEYNIYIETELGTISNISFKNNSPIYKPSINYGDNIVEIVNNGIDKNVDVFKINKEFDSREDLDASFSNQNWRIESGVLKSEKIGNGSTTENEFIVNAEAGDKLQLNIKTSSENNHDWGYVYLNGDEVYKKSGTTTDFEVLELDLQEGENVIKFIYTKDSSGYNENDAMFIDYIKLMKKEVVTIDCDTLEYRINGGQWQTYANSFELNYPVGTKVLVEVRAKHDGFTSTILAQEVTVELNTKDIEDAIEKAEESKDTSDISDARDLVNQMPESMKKDEFQNRLDAIFPSLALGKETATANLDIYIKSENMLSLSLDTSSITFENYSGVADVEMLGAVNITINSSLPYSLNAYMPTEIANSDKSNIMDLSVFNIRENSNDIYSKFENHTDKAVLKDNCEKGNGNTHTIDIKLSGNEAHKADIYKTVIKFEAEQK